MYRPFVACRLSFGWCANPLSELCHTQSDTARSVAQHTARTINERPCCTKLSDHCKRSKRPAAWHLGVFRRSGDTSTSSEPSPESRKTIDINIVCECMLLTFARHHSLGRCCWPAGKVLCLSDTFAETAPMTCNISARLKRLLKAYPAPQSMRTPRSLPY